MANTSAICHSTYNSVDIHIYLANKGHAPHMHPKNGMQEEGEKKNDDNEEEKMKMQ